MKKLLLALATLIPAASFGQILPSGNHLDVTHKAAFLLAFANVQKEVGIAPAGRKQIAKVLADYSKQQESLIQKQPDEIALARLDVSAADQILAPLTAGQKRKLQKAAVRIGGPSLLLEKQVRASLGIDKDLYSDIKSILYRAAKPSQKLEEVIGAQVNAAKTNAAKIAIQEQYTAERDRLAKLQAEEEAKALGLLTDEQKKRFLAGDF